MQATLAARSWSRRSIEVVHRDARYRIVYDGRNLGFDNSLTRQGTMTHGVMIAVHAAAAAAHARTRVLDAFRLQGATAPERARPLAELGLAADDRAMASLVEAGVIRGVDARGRPTVLGDEFARPRAFYLDEASAIVDRDRGCGNPRRRKVILVISIGLAVLAALLILMLARAGPTAS